MKISLINLGECILVFDSHNEKIFRRSIMLRYISDHLHHQRIFKLQCSLHQHLQTITFNGNIKLSTESAL